MHFELKLGDRQAKLTSNQSLQNWSYIVSVSGKIYPIIKFFIDESFISKPDNRNKHVMVTQDSLLIEGLNEADLWAIIQEVSYVA